MKKIIFLLFLLVLCSFSKVFADVGVNISKTVEREDIISGAEEYIGYITVSNNSNERENVVVVSDSLFPVFFEKNNFILGAGESEDVGIFVYVPIDYDGDMSFKVDVKVISGNVYATASEFFVLNVIGRGLSGDEVREIEKELNSMKDELKQKEDELNLYSYQIRACKERCATYENRFYISLCLCLVLTFVIGLLLRKLFKVDVGE